MSEELRREVRVDSGHDLRIIWLLHGQEGTVQFVLRIAKQKPDPRWPSIAHYDVTPWDIGIHSRQPFSYDSGAGPSFENCHILGDKCWFDGSGLAPAELLKEIYESGESGAEELIWQKLEEWYKSHADDQLRGAVSA